MLQDASVLIMSGMYRSGASIAAALLQSAGLHIGRGFLGDNHKKMPSGFENIDFVNFHETVLNSQGISPEGWTLQEEIYVDDFYLTRAQQLIAKNSISSMWGWKDPRTTLFLDFWSNQLPQANFLLLYRAPWDVVDSLYRRGAEEIFQKEPELAVKLWLHYNQKILRFCNFFPHRCLLVNLQTIVDFPNPLIETLNQKFGTKLSKPSEQTFDPELLHNQSPNSHRLNLIDYYFPEAIEMYQELEARAWTPNAELDLSWRDRLQSEPYRVWAFQDWFNLKQKENEIQAKNEELEALQTQLQETESLLDRSQSQLNQTELELQQRLAQLHYTQEEVEAFQLSLKEKNRLISSSKVRQVAAKNPREAYYNLIGEAWEAYKRDDSEEMAALLQQSLKYTPLSVTETTIDWLNHFNKWSAEQNFDFDAEALTNLEDWRQLVRQCLATSRSKAFSN